MESILKGREKGSVGTTAEIKVQNPESRENCEIAVSSSVGLACEGGGRGPVSCLPSGEYFHNVRVEAGVQFLAYPVEGILHNSSLWEAAVKLSGQVVMGQKSDNQ